MKQVLHFLGVYTHTYTFVRYSRVSIACILKVQCTRCVCVCVCDTSVQIRYTRVVLAARILRNTFDDC